MSKTTFTSIKKFTALLLVFTIAFSPLGLLSPTIAKASTTDDWSDQAKIRPGFMSGSERTDIFIDYFIPFGNNPNSLFYFDINGRIDDEDSNEQNFGFGFRTLSGGEKYILGGNIFFDTMMSEHDNRFSQVGFGLEVLTNRFDGRFNYYKPTGDTYLKGESNNYKFAPSSLLVNNGYEEALEGYDIELGVLVPYVSSFAETRLFGGLYNYSTDQLIADDVDGKKFRLEVRPLNSISINIEHYTPSEGDSDTVAGLYFDIPFSIEELFEAGGNPFINAPSEFKIENRANRTLRDRMTEKVIRDRQIITAADEDKTYKDLIYVNSDDTGADTGTQSDPYQTLTDALADAKWANEDTIIYISSTDGTADTYVNTVTLLDGQELWSDGVMHPIYKLGGGGVAAIINGSGGNIITLSDNNSIVGLDLINGNNGIYGSGTYDIVPATDTSIYSTFIAGNNIQNMTANGIYISNGYTSSDDISDLTFSLDIRGNNLSNNGANGIYIENIFDTTGTAENITFNNYIATNVLNDNTDDGIQIYQELIAEESATNIFVTNTLDSNWMDSNSMNGAYIDTNIEATVVYATTLDPSASTLSGSITNNFYSNSVDGNARAGVNINNSTLYSDAVSAAATSTIGLSSSTNGIITNYFDSNTFNNNGEQGILINKALIASITVATNSTITGDVSSTSTGTINNYFSNNTVDSNDSHGISLSNNLVTTHTLGTVNTTVDGNIAASSAGSSINTTFNTNTITNNGFTANKSGVYIDNDIYSEGEADDNSHVTGNVTASSSNSNTTINLTANTIDGNDNHGIEIFDNSIDAITTLGELSGTTTADGSIIATNNYSTAKIISNGNSYSSNGADGFNLTGQYIYSDSWASEDSATTGDISASSSNSLVSIDFTSDTVIDNTGYGVNITDNVVEAFAWGTNFTSLMTIGGDVTALAENSSANISSDNSNFSYNLGSDGFYSSYSGIYTETWLEGDYDLGGNILTSVDSSNVTNTFTNNTASFNNGSGILLDSQEVQAYLYAALNSGTVSGNITSSASDTKLTNTFTDNSANYNGNKGLYLNSNLILSTTEVDNNTTINGTAYSSVASSSINNTVSSNITNSNTNEGIFLQIFGPNAAHVVTSGTVTGTETTNVTNAQVIAATDSNISLSNSDDGLYISTSTATADNGETSITISGTGNTISDNTSASGIHLVHSGPTTSYSATFNDNTITNNTTHDMINNTGTTVDALNNWWGSATPNFATILTGDPIDYDPWTGK